MIILRIVRDALRMFNRHIIEIDYFQPEHNITHGNRQPRRSIFLDPKFFFLRISRFKIPLFLGVVDPKFLTQQNFACASGPMMGSVRFLGLVEARILYGLLHHVSQLFL